MAKHQKPTQEELLKTEQEAIEAGEQQIEAEKIEEEPTDVPETEPEAEIEASQEEVVPEEAPEEPEKPQAEPSKELYKKKFSESSREAQKLNAKNRVINQALVEADELPEPTDEELSKMPEFKDWDIMSDTERLLAKETIISRNWRKVISQAKEQATKIEKWNKSVDDYIDNPKTLIDSPELEGRLDGFRTFAQTEENNSVPMNILVSAYLHEATKGKPVNKGSQFETGSGGANEKQVNTGGKLTVEEGRRLRETDYGKWKEMLGAGKISQDF